VCEKRRATVFCESDQAAFCADCDKAVHSCENALSLSSSPRHADPCFSSAANKILARHTRVDIQQMRKPELGRCPSHPKSVQRASHERSHSAANSSLAQASSRVLLPQLPDSRLHSLQDGRLALHGRRSEPQGMHLTRRVRTAGCCAHKLQHAVGARRRGVEEGRQRFLSARPWY
jgi:hypothetical protein